MTHTLGMDIVQILGLAAAAFTTAANIPQTIKIIKTRSTEDISVLTYTLLLIGLLLWITYGFLKDDLPIILANIISALICMTIIILKLMPQRKLDDLHDKIKAGDSKQE